MGKILVIRTDRFGEFLLNIPAIRAVREKFPQSHITAMVQPYIEEIAKGISFIDEVISYDAYKAQKGLSSTLKLLSFLKKQRFDLAIILNPAKKFNIITFLARIPVRVGYNRKWPFLLTHRLKDKKYEGTKHEVEYNLDLVRLIGADTEDKNIDIDINKEDEDFINELLSRNGLCQDNNLVVIHPWSSNPKKMWPQDRFVELAKKIINELKAKAIIVGGKEKLPLSAQLFKDISPDLIDLTGFLSLRQLAALFKRSRIVISCDSGPMHLASAVKTPVLALFRKGVSAVSAKRWGPWGEGNIVIEKGELEEISVEEVIEAVTQLLKDE